MNNFEKVNQEYKQLLNRSKRTLALSRWVPFAILMTFVLISVGLASLKPVPESVTKIFIFMGVGLWLGSMGFFIRALSKKDLTNFEMDLLTKVWTDEEAVKMISLRIQFLNSEVSIPSGSKVVTELYSRLNDDSSKLLFETLNTSDRKWILANQMEENTE
ncbi:MAG: hypothetical protein KF836_13510 [Fimbriimonadaceae bacterium]|nr:hypothetical protein [Fimbriimonadaceae bacterium]